MTTKQKYGKFIDEEYARADSNQYKSDRNDVNTASMLERQNEENFKFDKFLKMSLEEEPELNESKADQNQYSNFYDNNHLNDASGIDLVPKRPSLLNSPNVVNISNEQGVNEWIDDIRVDSESSPNMITVQFKVNDRSINNGLPLLTTVDLETTVGELKQKMFSDQLNEGKVVRLLYGKMMQDDEKLSKYKLKNMCFLHAIISFPLNRPEGAKPSDGQNISTDGKIGFDRIIRMRNKQYTDLQVHQMRLALHSILMRSGVEKTDETADGLLQNEEKWLNGQLPNDDQLTELMDRKSKCFWLIL